MSNYHNGTYVCWEEGHRQPSSNVAIIITYYQQSLPLIMNKNTGVGKGKWLCLLCIPCTELAKLKIPDVVFSHSHTIFFFLKQTNKQKSFFDTHILKDLELSRSKYQSCTRIHVMRCKNSNVFICSFLIMTLYFYLLTL